MGFSRREDKNTRVGCHFLVQGIFPIQGLNLGFLHCRQILYLLSHQGKLQVSIREVGFACAAAAKQVTSVVSNSVWPHRRQPTRLPHPWDSQGKNTGVGCHFLLQCMKMKRESEVVQSCPTRSDPMDCSPPGSSARGIFQARVLEWSAIAFSVCMCCELQMFVSDLFFVFWHSWAALLGYNSHYTVRPFVANDLSGFCAALGTVGVRTASSPPRAASPPLPVAVHPQPPTNLLSALPGSACCGSFI